jgi:hypothetical protein
VLNYSKTQNLNYVAFRTFSQQVKERRAHFSYLLSNQSKKEEEIPPEMSQMVRAKSSLSLSVSHILTSKNFCAILQFF